MCRTVHAVLSTAICGIQMLVRVFMTIILMIENVIRMVLQTLYNFISFVLQMLSLIPICVVFLLTARLKCFMCGGGGPCPVNRGGACDCIMSALAIAILFFIFRATGVLDKMFYSIGYAKALPPVPARFVPTPGDITECSRNDTDYTDFYSTTIIQLIEDMTYELSTNEGGDAALAGGEEHHDYDDVQQDDGVGRKRVKLVSNTQQFLTTLMNRGKKESTATETHSYEQLTTEMIYDPNG